MNYILSKRKKQAIEHFLNEVSEKKSSIIGKKYKEDDV